MTIWIAALVLIGLCGLVSYYQGALRALFTLLGLFIALFVSVPLGHFFETMLAAVGIKSPYLAILLAPVVVFILVVVVFKIGAALVHKQVMAHIHKTQPEYRYLVWEKMNQRTGIMIGIGNAALYLIAGCGLIYPAGYLATQVSAEEGEHFVVNFIRKAAADVDQTGMDRVIGYFGWVPAKYYEGADVLGEIYKNPLLQKRLARYPGVLNLVERAEFQTLGKDAKFKEILATQPKLSELLQNETLLGIVHSDDYRAEFWKLDFSDLLAFLKTGQSKYDEQKILGRWRLDANSFLSGVKAAMPTIPSSTMKQMKDMAPLLERNVFIVIGPDNKMVIKGAPFTKPLLFLGMGGGTPATAEAMTQQEVLASGEWKDEDGSYKATLPDIVNKTATSPVKISGNSLIIQRRPPVPPLAFVREE